MGTSAMAEIRNYTINFGPQHPAAHGVLRLVLELDGWPFSPALRLSRSFAHEANSDVIFTGAGLQWQPNNRA